MLDVILAVSFNMTNFFSIFDKRNKGLTDVHTFNSKYRNIKSSFIDKDSKQG